MPVHQFLYHHQHEWQINRMICLSLSIVSLRGFKSKHHINLSTSFGYIPTFQTGCKYTAQMSARCPVPCCSSAGTIPSVPADLNDLDILILVCFALIDNASIQFTVFVSHKCSQVWPFLPFIDHFHLSDIMENEPCEGAPGSLFPVCAYQPSGCSIDPTLLADWLAMVVISLALLVTSSIPDSSSSKRTVLPFLSFYCNRWESSFMIPSYLFL